MSSQFGKFDILISTVSKEPTVDAKVLGLIPCSILRHSGIWGAADEAALNIFGGLSVLATPFYLCCLIGILRDVGTGIEPRGGACLKKQARHQLSHPSVYINHSSLITNTTRPALQIPLFWSTLNIEPQDCCRVPMKSELLPIIHRFNLTLLNLSWCEKIKIFLGFISQYRLKAQWSVSRDIHAMICCHELPVMNCPTVKNKPYCIECYTIVLTTNLQAW